jgi:isochorismate synthase
MIWHIKTNIAANYNEGSNLEQIVITSHTSCLFQKESKAFIIKHERYNRKYYTGFVGELNHKGPDSSLNSDLFVIRTMEIEGDSAHIYVGWHYKG